MTWECFQDASYYDMWCVRPVGSRTFGAGFHLVDGDEAKALCDALSAARDEVAELKADKARLDFLDECNQRLNARFGTNYGWKLILNHNVNRLMIGHMVVDLHDSEGSNRKLPSCRAAIDEKMREVQTARTALSSIQEGRNNG